MPVVDGFDSDIVIGNGVTSIGSYAFAAWTAISTVYYAGTQQNWQNITINSNNTDLLNANIEYNYNN